MSRDAMVASLKEIFVPALRERGFTGSFPHFRRIGTDHIDLLSVTFGRTGNFFFVELAKCGLEGITTHSGEPVPPSKVTAFHVYPPNRPRLGFTTNGGSGVWFNHGDGTPVDILAHRALQLLPEADEWWKASGAVEAK